MKYLSLYILLFIPLTCFSDDILSSLKDCEIRSSNTLGNNLLITNETKLLLEQSVISPRAKKLIHYYSKLSVQKWDKLKTNCPKMAFNLFMLNSAQSNEMFPIVTAKGFPLGESYKFSLNSVHQKVFKRYTLNIINNFNCGLPILSTYTNYRPLSAIREIISHPDYPTHSMSTVYKCIDQVEKKIRKFIQFKNRPRCNGIFYLLNGNIGKTQKGKWIEKDLFCEGYRSFQILDLITHQVQDLISTEAYSIITSKGPFKNENPAQKCKHYYYHSKRKSCYPKD
jgi:hypothetical protein